MYEADLDSFVRTATAICGSREAGRDAVHDAFVSAIKGRRRYRRTGTVEAWLWSSVVRTALKQRSRRRDLPSADPLAGREPLSEDGNPEELAGVRAAIALLPERQRLVLFLRYYGDLDYAQIGRALGIKRGTVSAALHAAHQSLRTHFEEVESDVRRT